MNEAMVDPKEVFLAALECESPEELARFLDEACGGDRDVQAEVEQLLRAHRRAGKFLNGPETPLNSRSAEELVGSSIGPYRLLELIGEGGMGVVFKAEQIEPVRRMVALKIIKPGMDSEQVISRFAAERQALALMDHPNIARVLDAGTTATGLPYFVMDLVPGIPITDYCDRHRLKMRERLALLAVVSQAVQHAHQKGVIHRDLKPSNVLVSDDDGKAVPKVIDFGIAKATGSQLSAGSSSTHCGQIVGTLEYMSPEQAGLGEPDVDTRSDVYSLGVLLYELLVGSTPLDKERLADAAIEQALRMIREEEAPRPSARVCRLDASLATEVAARQQMQPHRLVHSLRGELDWIVMKCLEKDRNRRYETASALAQDLERYLADKPVEACPPSTIYRLGKLARRNWGALAVGLALLTALLVLVAGLAVSNRTIAASRNEAAAALRERELAFEKARASAEEAQVQRRRAEESSRRALTAVRDLLISPAISHAEWSQIPAPLRRKFREEAATFYARVLEGGPTDPALRYETAVGQRALGYLYQQTDAADEAETLVRQSVEILEGLHREAPTNRDYRHQLALSHFTLFQTLWWQQRLEAAEESGQRAIELYEGLMANQRALPNYAHEVAAVYQSMGSLLTNDVRRLDEAERAYLRGIKINEQRLASLSPGAAAPAELVRSYEALATLYLRQERMEEAAESYSRTLELVPNDPKRWYGAAAFYLWCGDVERYRSACGELLARAERLSANNPNIADWAAKTCALAPDAVPDFARVEPLAERCVTGTENHPWRRNFLLAKGLTDYRAGRPEKALAWLDQFAPRPGGEHFDATAFAALAMAHHRLGQEERARVALEAARAIVAGRPASGLASPFWFDWLHGEILLREAERLVE